MENGNGEHAAVHIPAEALPRRMSNVEVTLSWKARSGPPELSGTNHVPTVVASPSLRAPRRVLQKRSSVLVCNVHHPSRSDARTDAGLARTWR
jgi:hypothetical protein